MCSLLGLAGWQLLSVTRPCSTPRATGQATPCCLSPQTFPRPLRTGRKGWVFGHHAGHIGASLILGVTGEGRGTMRAAEGYQRSPSSERERSVCPSVKTTWLPGGSGSGKKGGQFYRTVETLSLRPSSTRPPHTHTLRGVKNQRPQRWPKGADGRTGRHPTSNTFTGGCFVDLSVTAVPSDPEPSSALLPVQLRHGQEPVLAWLLCEDRGSHGGQHSAGWHPPLHVLSPKELHSTRGHTRCQSPATVGGQAMRLGGTVPVPRLTASAARPPSCHRGHRGTMRPALTGNDGSSLTRACLGRWLD